MQPEPQVAEGLSGAVDVGAGERHSCAVLDDGTVFCWGSNGEEQLGQGFLNDRAMQTTPFEVARIDSAVAVELGRETSCAVLANGRVQCWGDNSDRLVTGSQILDIGPNQQGSGIATPATVTFR